MKKILLSLTSACIALAPSLCRAQAAKRATPQILKAVPVAKASPAPITNSSPSPTASSTPVSSGGDLVSVRSIDPGIQVELRYATERNVLRRPIYSPKMPALVRPSVAARLSVAQSYLKARGFSLKIWDAFRPRGAQDQLWQFLPDRSFVANPADNMALHNWGVAVDATIVYANGQAVSMPTDFDEFTPGATLHYTGSNGAIGEHLHILQRAMAQAGFYGMETEWWHFIAKDWKDFGPIDETKNIVPQLPPPTVRSSPPPTSRIPASRPRSVSR